MQIPLAAPERKRERLLRASRPFCDRAGRRRAEAKRGFDFKAESNQNDIVRVMMTTVLANGMSDLRNISSFRRLRQRDHGLIEC
jgi:hypothetical protein